VAKSGAREYVGLVEATVTRDDSVQLAYFVFADHQRQGYSAEMVRLVLDHLTSALDLKTARALVDTRNVASQRLLAHLSFERKRLIEMADNFKGASSDEFEYELNLAP
jgi:RimJ/RimL family protein N-acetyltransferase